MQPLRLELSVFDEYAPLKSSSIAKISIKEVLFEYDSPYSEGYSYLGGGLLPFSVWLYNSVQ